MRQYTFPQVIVQQDFALIPAAATQELLSVIIGPHKRVISLTDPDDNQYTGYGDYLFDDPLGVTYPIKGRVDTEDLDVKSVKVTFKDIYARYASIATREAGDPLTVNQIHLKNNTRNYIELGEDTGGGFIKYGDYETRASAFIKRDVKIGDNIKITIGSGDSEFNTESRVLEIIHDVVEPSVIGENYQASATDVITGTMMTPGTMALTGHENVAKISTSDWSEIYASPEGDFFVIKDPTSPEIYSYYAGIPEDFYTFKVTKSGMPGQAEFTVTSLLDGAAPKTYVVPNLIAGGQPGSIIVGNRGLVVKLRGHVGTLGSPEIPAIPEILEDLNAEPPIPYSPAVPAVPAVPADPNNGKFTAGREYKAKITSEYFPLSCLVTSSSANDYLGQIETTYEVKVVKGGLWQNGPQITVSTSNGVDLYGPQIIKGLGADKSFYLGALGLKAYFASQDYRDVSLGLVAGDTFYIKATPQKKGSARTLRLSESVPAAAIPDGMSTANVPITVDFYIKKDSIEIPATNYPNFGNLAWEISSDKENITFHNSIQIVDDSWVDFTGLSKIPIDVHKAKMFVEYTSLRKELSNQLTSFSTLASVQNILGDVEPENTLAYGVYKALMNSAGRTVYAVAVETDDLEGYTAALTVTEGEVRSYYMVPLTKDENVIQLFKAHVLKMSDPTMAMERITLVNQEFVPVLDLYNKKSDVDERWAGYVTKKTGTDSYSFVTVPGASFMSDGIRVGDIFRSNFGTDAFGNEIYESHIITNIVDEDNLELETPAFANPVGHANQLKTIQIVRNLSRDECAIKIGQNSAELGTRRAVNVWPDYGMDGNKRIPGYHIAAAIAGLKSSVAPHQPLTNVTLNGFTEITRSAPYFTPTQLNRIANGGTWIVTKDLETGAIINRHQLTTDYSDDNMSEVSITTNLDSISKWLRDDLRVIIGQYNNHPYMIQLIRTRLEYRLTYLQGHARTAKAGPQIISFRINKVAVDELIKTRVNADIDLVLPFPINNINLQLTVVPDLAEQSLDAQIAAAAAAAAEKK